MKGEGPLYIVHAILALGVEIAVLVAMVRFGRTMVEGFWGWGLGFLCMGGIIALWALWGAPNSATRLDGTALLVFKSAVFLTATLAFWISSGPMGAAVFAIITMIHLALALQQGWL